LSKGDLQTCGRHAIQAFWNFFSSFPVWTPILPDPTASGLSDGTHSLIKGRLLQSPPLLSYQTEIMQTCYTGRSATGMQNALKRHAQESA